MAFDLDPAYKQVPERLADFKAKHPDGSLQAADPAHPFELVTVGSQTWLVYSALAYRTPDDPRPGQGTAWEPIPGKTPYTRDSEMQNAETSAWGRAIVAVLASESKSIASAEDVRNRRADQDESQHLPPPDPPVPNGWESWELLDLAWTTLRTATAKLEADLAADVKKWLKERGVTRLHLTPELAGEWEALLPADVPSKTPESPPTASGANGAGKPAPDLQALTQQGDDDAWREASDDEQHQYEMVVKEMTAPKVDEALTDQGLTISGPLSARRDRLARRLVHIDALEASTT